VSSGGLLSGGLTLSGGTATISGSVSSSVTVTFVSAGGDLILKNPSTFAAEIGGFTLTTQEIDLLGYAYNSSTETRSWTEAASNTSGTLTVVDGSKTATLNLLGSYSTANFTLSSDGAGGTLIIDPPVEADTDADLHQLIEAIASYGVKPGLATGAHAFPPDPAHLPYVATPH
jgi:hypothetical protein